MKELEIVQLIKNNSNWKEILQNKPYSLMIAEKDNLILFYYTLPSEPCEIVNEARGLILEKDTWKVIRYGLYRFYNLGERGVAELDKDSIYATEKIDGSLVMFYYYDGWHISTRKAFDADDKFGTLIRQAMQKQKIDFAELNKEYTYVFELVSPENTIVIPYSETKLYFLMCRDNQTLEEVPDNHDWIRPQVYSVRSLDEMIAFVSKYEWDELEGVVLQDKYHQRIKLKNMNWVRAHKLLGSVSVRSVLEMILTGEDGEFLSYFPEYKQMFDEVQSAYQKLLQYAEEADNADYDVTYPERKEFAEMVKQKELTPAYANLLFCAYTHKAKNFIENLGSSAVSKFPDFFEEIEKRSE